MAGLGLKCETGHSPVSRECAYPDLGLHTTKLMVCEPMAVRNQLDVSLQVRWHTCVRVGKRRHICIPTCGTWNEDWWRRV